MKTFSTVVFPSSRFWLERPLLFVEFVVQFRLLPLAENKQFHLFCLNNATMPPTDLPAYGGPAIYEVGWKNARKLLLEMSRIGNKFFSHSLSQPFSFVCNHGLIALSTMWAIGFAQFCVCTLWYHLWLYSHCELVRKHSRIAIYFRAGIRTLLSHSSLTSTNICEFLSNRRMGQSSRFNHSICSQAFYF